MNFVSMEDSTKKAPPPPRAPNPPPPIPNQPEPGKNLPDDVPASDL
jgi:hypothetical protein